MKIRKMTGIFASVFAHTGHISKDDAKEISGLDDHAFEEAYSKASNIAGKFAMNTFLVKDDSWKP